MLFKVLNSPEAIFQISLSGRYGIEASAGTGKTWTIASFWIRFLVCEALTVDQLLVLTYTRASVSDLAVRLYERLLDVLKYDPDLPGDPLSFESYIYAVVQDPALVKQRVLKALQHFDQHAIFTIHSFCQRILTQHPIATAGRTPTLNNAPHVLSRLVFDYWREMHHPDWQGPFQDVLADRYLMRTMRAEGLSPQSLLRSWQQSLQHRDHLSFRYPVVVLGELSWSTLWSEWQAAYAAIAQDLLAKEEIIAKLSAGGLHKQQYRIQDFERWFQEISLWVLSPHWQLPAALYKCSEQSLLRYTNKGKQPPEHPFFRHVQVLCDLLIAMRPLIDQARVCWYQQCFSVLLERLIAEEKRLDFLRFDDLIVAVYEALEADVDGTFAGRVSAQYPVLLFDESQDTDRHQFAIVDRVWTSAHCQIFVGDPKQAIYGFRGADVFSYMRFMSQIPETCRYSLSTNYRSDPRLVSAVQALFCYHEEAFLSEEVSIHELSSAYVSQLSDGDSAALVFMKPPSWALQPRLQQCVWAAEAAAQEILRLLQDSSIQYQGRQLSCQDIAVLVRSHDQAQLVYQALHRHHIPSRRQARVNMFLQEPVLWIESMLMMLCYPFHQGYVRAVLTSPLVGLSLSDLVIGVEEARLDSPVMARLVQSKGFLFVLHQLLYRFDFAGRCTEKPDQQRCLYALAEYLNRRRGYTVFQLLNLVQDKKREAEQGLGSDEVMLPSSYAEESVSILTQHTAKGLEFPIVFCPFLGCGPSATSQGIVPDSEGNYVFDCVSSLQDSRHLLAEEVRLAYVALTRAKERVYVACFPYTLTKRREYVNAPLWWLLFSRGIEAWLHEATDHLFHELQIALDHFVVSVPGVACCEYVLDHGLVYDRGLDDQPDSAELSVPSAVLPAWFFRSFTALSDYFLDPHLRAVDLGGPAIVSEWAELGSGAQFGVLVHSLMEKMTQLDTSSVRSLLHQHACPDSWLDPLLNLCQMWRKLPIFDDGGCYEEATARYQEKEFLFLSHALSTEAMSVVLDDYEIPYPQMAPVSWPVSFFKGAIDSIVLYKTRYYIVDWKTNDLGKGLAAYHGPVLRMAMGEHGYAIQGMVYLLALHLWLSRRVLDYQYDRDCGGMCYVFLRGLHPLYPGYGVWSYRPSLACIESFAQSIGVPVC